MKVEIEAEARRIWELGIAIEHYIQSEVERVSSDVDELPPRLRDMEKIKDQLLDAFVEIELGEDYQP